MSHICNVNDDIDAHKRERMGTGFSYFPLMCDDLYARNTIVISTGKLGVTLGEVKPAKYIVSLQGLSKPIKSKGAVALHNFRDANGKRIVETSGYFYMVPCDNMENVQQVLDSMVEGWTAGESRAYVLSTANGKLTQMSGGGLEAYI